MVETTLFLLLLQKRELLFPCRRRTPGLKGSCVIELHVCVRACACRERILAFETKFELRVMVLRCSGREPEL